MKKKTGLIILDGWGLGPDEANNAVKLARTPVMKALTKKFPHATLLTSGEDVGLPDGQMGNSEVGHLNIGAGRVVFQDLVRINVAVRQGNFFREKVLLDTFRYVKENNQTLHLMGLLSDGGVHSHITHLFALCEFAAREKVDKIMIHAFTDGRDTDPKSGLLYLTQLMEFLHANPGYGQIASVCGRYFAMDRDKRWERVKLAWDMLVHGSGKPTNDFLSELKACYANGETDEFIKPLIAIDENGLAKGKLQQGDAVICFNFRTDRCREITEVLTQRDLPEFGMHKLDLNYVTMTRYDEKFKDVKVVYEKDNLSMTLGEVLSRHGASQLRIAETEKYPHVTFFFSGGREDVFAGESRIMVPSPKVPTYDLQPEMSAAEITSKAIEFLSTECPDFFCLNFANPDMVGHTGVLPAVIKAVETVDDCLGKLLNEGVKLGYELIVIADHGNADYMINDDGSPNTAHTTNPVPFILVSERVSELVSGRLADIAPTILELMGFSKPNEMTGNSLIKKWIL
jgi:2,3-bisphosphoglycerate-independent phosphoglycerate mutase